MRRGPLTTEGHARRVDETAGFFRKHLFFMDAAEGRRQARNSRRDRARKAFAAMQPEAATSWLAAAAVEGIKNWRKPHPVHEILRDIAADLIQDCKPLPQPLRVYLRKVLHEPVPTGKRKGPHPDSRALRNALIVRRLEHLQRLAVLPTRNDVSDGACGCTIVAEALSRVGIRIGEKAVKTIWNRRKK